MTISAGQTSSHADSRRATFHQEHARGIQQILVCLDRSPLAEACLPHARFVAQALGATITLLHVMPTPEDGQAASQPDALGWEITRREAEQYLSAVRKEFERQAAIELTQGRPAERIVTLARELDMDLIVLARHGEGGPGVWNIGSTAQQVLALAPTSVLVVPSELGRIVNVPPKRIMVPLDGSLRTESVLPPVVQLARSVGAEVLLVHVVAEPTPTGVLSATEDLALAQRLAAQLEAGAEQYLSRVQRQLLPEIPRVETLVLRRTDQRRALLEVAAQRQVDLLVFAAHGTTCDAERTFGSVTAYVLNHTRLPLLVLQDLTQSERDSVRPLESSSSLASVRGPFSTRPLEGN